MKAYHKQTVLVLDQGDFFPRGQVEIDDYHQVDLCSSDRRLKFTEASVVILKVGAESKILKEAL